MPHPPKLPTILMNCPRVKSRSSIETKGSSRSALIAACGRRWQKPRELPLAYPIMSRPCCVHAARHRPDRGSRMEPNGSSYVLGNHEVRLAEDGVGKRDVEPEGLPINLACELTCHAVPQTFIGHPLVRDLWVFGVRRHYEPHEVPELECGSSFEARVQRRGRSDDAKIDVLRGPGPLDPILDDQSALQHHGIAKH